MKRITKKIICLLTVATMLLVATVTAVGAVSTPDTADEGQENTFKSYCINKTTGDLQHAEMVYSNEHYDTVTAVYNNLTAGTYEFGATGSPYFNEPVSTEVELTKDGSVRVYYYLVTNEIETVVYEDSEAPAEKLEALVQTSDGDFVQGVLLSTSTEHYDCVTGVVNNLKAGSYNVLVRDGNDLLADEDFTLSNDGSVRINYYTVSKEIEVVKYDTEEVPEERYAASITDSTGNCLQEIHLETSSRHYDCLTGVFNNLKADTYTVEVRNTAGVLATKSFTLKNDGSARIFYYGLADEIEVVTYDSENAPYEDPTGYLMSGDKLVDTLIFEPTVHSGIYTYISKNVKAGNYRVVILTGKGTMLEKEITITVAGDVLFTYTQSDDEFTFVEMGTITPDDDNTNPTTSADSSSSTSDVASNGNANSNNDNGVVKTGDSPVVSIVLLSALTLAAAGMFFAKRKFDF